MVYKDRIDVVLERLQETWLMVLKRFRRGNGRLDMYTTQEAVLKKSRSNQGKYVEVNKTPQVHLL